MLVQPVGPVHLGGGAELRVDDPPAGNVDLAAEYDQRIAAARAEVDAARKEWQTAIGEAKKKRQASEAEDKALDIPRGPDDYDFGSINQAVAEVRRNMFAAQGTFNAAAIPGMGVGGAAERTAKATEATAKNTQKLLEHAKLGGLEFE